MTAPYRQLEHNPNTTSHKKHTQLLRQGVRIVLSQDKGINEGQIHSGELQLRDQPHKVIPAWKRGWGGWAVKTSIQHSARLQFSCNQHWYCEQTEGVVGPLQVNREKGYSCSGQSGRRSDAI